MSTIKATNIQLGSNGDASRNFVWQTNNDGTAKLARGNVGSTIQDIINVDVDGKVSFPQNDVVNVSPVKAFVNFDATRNAAGGADSAATNRFIRSSSNVASVLRQSTGRFLVTFSTPMANANYVAMVTSCADSDSGNLNPPAVVSRLAASCIIDVESAGGSQQIDNVLNDLVVFSV